MTIDDEEPNRTDKATGKTAAVLDLLEMLKETGYNVRVQDMRPDHVTQRLPYGHGLSEDDHPAVYSDTDWSFPEANSREPIYVILVDEIDCLKSREDN